MFYLLFSHLSSLLFFSQGGFFFWINGIHFLWDSITVSLNSLYVTCYDLTLLASSSFSFLKLSMTAADVLAFAASARMLNLKALCPLRQSGPLTIILWTACSSVAWLSRAAFALVASLTGRSMKWSLMVSQRADSTLYPDMTFSQATKGSQKLFILIVFAALKSSLFSQNVTVTIPVLVSQWII